MVIKSLQNDFSEIETKIKSETPFKVQIVWRNVILMIILHTSAIYGFYISVVGAKWQTWIFGYVIGMFSSMGIQAGSHRLWCHRSYEAKLPLRIFLAFAHTLALQNSIYEWCRDHRVHHKYSETDADPHNSKRGFFFSHVGWLLCKKHPDVKTKGKTVDLSDLMCDPVVRFQKKYYIPLIIVIWGLMPTYIPHLLWNESIWISWFACVMFRYCYTLNITWLVNSAAHRWGYRPYDQQIEARETTFTRHMLQGEGFHNYHHTFPWDYSASELGSFQVFNPATAFIDFCANLGLAYNLKVVSPQIIKNKIKLNDKTDNKLAVNVLFDWSLGLIIISWPLWSAFVIRKLL